MMGKYAHIISAFFILFLLVGIAAQQQTINELRDIDCPDCPKPECPKPKCPEATCPKPECPEPVCQKRDCPEQGLIKRMIEPMGENHQYELDIYDCTQYAQETARRLRDKGFEAETKLVRVDCNYFNCTSGNLHEITEAKIYIEPINGNVIDPQNYERYNLD